MADTKYKPIPFVFRSHGLVARHAVDRPPDQNFFLNMAGALERAEDAVSTRYGNIIINRDAIGAGTSNYLLPSAPVRLARLRIVSGSPPLPLVYRYAGLADGSLYRRATDVQGVYSKILDIGALSGSPFSTLVTTCFQSSAPWMLIHDRKAMYKDNGSGTPSRLGIMPPVRPVTSRAYAPSILTINVFNNASGYTVSGGLTVTALENAFSIAGTGGASQLSGNYERYTGGTGYFNPTDGMLCSSGMADGAWRLKFQTNKLTGQFDIKSLNNVYAAADTFNFPDVRCTVASNSVGTIGKSLGTASPAVPLDLSTYQSADLFILAFKVASPANVQEIRVMFDVNQSSYTSSYYTKTLVPVSYQGYLDNSQTGDPVLALVNQAFQQSAISAGDAASNADAVRSSTPGGAQPKRSNMAVETQAGPFGANSGPFGGVDDIWGDTGGGTGTTGTGSGLTPSQMTSGIGSWTIVYLQKGDFLPVGNAGQQGLDWSNITGWRIQVTTNTGGSSDVSFNALYIQGGGATSSPAVPASGPSSFGGVSYDFRYIYYNANTGTPSNGSPPQRYDVTATNPGGLSTLYPMRQAVNLVGQYSSDPQVTHVKIYARGGLFGANWWYADQIPNVTGTGTFSYKYVIPDNALTQSDPLNLANDVPVTSTLRQPITTTLTALPSPTTTLLNLGDKAPANTYTIILAEYSGGSLVTFTQSVTVTILSPRIILVNTPDALTTNTWRAYISTDGGATYGYFDTAGPTGSVSLTATAVGALTPGTPPGATVLNPAPANTNIPTLMIVAVADATAEFVTNQIVFIGTPSNLEEVAVVTGGIGTFTAWVQMPHSYNEPVYSFAKPAQPLYLSALAYGQTWMAGDPNNPGYLYYTPIGYPENCPPQNYIPVSSPSDPVINVVETQGILFVSTLSTWYRIFPGNPPRAQKTGSVHGAVANFGWAVGEGEIWYAAADGIRTFQGTDGAYRSLIIEWLFRMTAMTPVTLVDLTKLDQMLVAFKNNGAVIVYPGVDGAPHRLLYNSSYHRWRNDDIAVTAMYLEADTNTLVYSKPMTIGGVSGWAIVYDSYSQDYDDGGWSSVPSGSPPAPQLLQLPIALTLQTPYGDQGIPNNQKQYNILTIDANPNGQVITPMLLFDDNDGSVAPVTPSPATFTGTKRAKFQFKINSGLGQQAYRASLRLTASVTAAPEIYQADLSTAVLTEVRSSYDTYWIKFNSDESKFTKQMFFDYTTVPSGSPPVSTDVISGALYLDGDMTTPYATFTLSANTTRSQVPIRVRFVPTGGVRSFRMVRLVLTTPGAFQLWSPIQCDWKPVSGGGKGYQRSNLGDVTPL